MLDFRTRKPGSVKQAKFEQCSKAVQALENILHGELYSRHHKLLESQAFYIIEIYVENAENNVGVTKISIQRSNLEQRHITIVYKITAEKILFFQGSDLEIQDWRNLVADLVTPATKEMDRKQPTAK